MNKAIECLGLVVLYAGCVAMAAAQQTSPSQNTSKATAQSEAGEPRADTSAAPPRNAATAPAASAARAPAAPVAPAASTARAPDAPAASTTSAARGSVAPPARTSGNGRAASSDRLDLGTATVTGSQEQPKVMYIVPWKRSDIGDLAGRPMNSLVDEILAPVDRDVFKREVVYYQAVQADASQNGAAGHPSQQVEK